MKTIPHKQIDRDKQAHQSLMEIKFIKDYIKPTKLFTEKRFIIELGVQKN